MPAGLQPWISSFALSLRAAGRAENTVRITSRSMVAYGASGLTSKGASMSWSGTETVLVDGGGQANDNL